MKVAAGVHNIALKWVLTKWHKAEARLSHGKPIDAWFLQQEKLGCDEVGKYILDAYSALWTKNCGYNYLEFCELWDHKQLIFLCHIWKTRCRMKEIILLSIIHASVQGKLKINWVSGNIHHFEYFRLKHPTTEKKNHFSENAVSKVVPTLILWH